jgi:hypothetical protein
MNRSQRLLIGAGAAALVAIDLAATKLLLVPPEQFAFALLLCVLLAAHSACALAAGALFAAIAPPFLRHSRREIAAFSACFVFFIPALGTIGVLAVLMRGSTKPLPSNDGEWLSCEAASDLEGLRRRVRGVRRRASAAAIADALAERRPESAGARLRAVLATRHLPANAAVPLLRAAQRDPSDEVRLYAFSRLEGMRGEIEKRIERLAAALEGAAPHQAPRLQLRLAESYAELGASGLTEGAVLEHVLESAHRHAAVACALMPGHAAAEFFLGKVLLQLRDPARATIAFGRAAFAGYPHQRLLPHLAECAFLERDWAAVRTFLLQLEESRRVSGGYEDVIELWAEAETRKPREQRTKPSEETSRVPPSADPRLSKTGVIS